LDRYATAGLANKDSTDPVAGAISWGDDTLADLAKNLFHVSHRNLWTEQSIRWMRGRVDPTVDQVLAVAQLYTN
jgi:hypothetical protein